MNPDPAPDPGDLIWGINSVGDVLRTGPERMHKLYLVEGRRNPRLQELLALARAAGVPVAFLPRHALDRLADGPHQGVAAALGETGFGDWRDAIAAAGERGEVPLLVVLDQIQDPHNLGAIARSSEAFGAHALVVPKHRSALPGGAAAKASAGALHTLPLCRVPNLARTLAEMQEIGLWIVGTAVEQGRSPAELDLTGPLALVIGSEEKGMRPVIADRCDLIATVALSGRTGSLNASVAAGIMLYEICRQRSGASR